MPHLEKKLNENIIYKGRIITVKNDTVVLENGKTAEREVVVHNGGVSVLPVYDNLDVLLVRQFRYPYYEEVLEAPAGKLEIGENPFEAGKRELAEEAGVVAEKYIDCGNLYPSPGYCSEIIHLYIAENLTQTAQNLDEDEFLDVVRLPLKQVFKMTMDGKIPDSKTQVLVLKAAQIHGILLE